MPDLNHIQLKDCEEEIYNYITQIMSLEPHEAVVVLSLTIGKIIHERDLNQKSKLDSIQSVTRLITMSALAKK